MPYSVEWICKTFQRSHHKSVCQTSSHLCLLCPTVQTKIVCLQASVGPKDNMQRSWLKKAVSFRNAFLHWRGWDLPWWTVLFWWTNISYMWNIEHSCHAWEVKIFMMLLNLSMSHWRSMYDMLWRKIKLSVLSFLKKLCWLMILLWLCVVSLWEQFSSYMLHYQTSPTIFVPFWTGSFLITG